MGESALCVTPLPRRHLRTVTLDCGESGSTLRFMLPIAACFAVETAYTGAGRLLERPMEPLANALAPHGLVLAGGRLTGSLVPGDYTIAGNVSSQFISGLLFALPLLDGDSVILHPAPI